MPDESGSITAESSTLSDYQVIDRVIQGDVALYEILMRRHNQRLFRLSRSVISNDSEAEDIVQEAFVRAYEALPKFERRASFATWVSRIAYHEALKERRRRKRDTDHRTGILHRHESNQSSVALPGMGRLICNEVHAMLTEAFDKLTPTHRSVIMLRLIEGLSTRETAECLRITESHVKVLLHRAKTQYAGSFDEDSIKGLREHFSFAGHRCDRCVVGVLDRIDY